MLLLSTNSDNNTYNPPSQTLPIEVASVFEQNQQKSQKSVNLFAYIKNL